MSVPLSTSVRSTDTSESSSWEATPISGSEWTRGEVDSILVPSNTILADLTLPPDNTDIGSYSELLSHFDAPSIIKDAILSRFGTFPFISRFTARFSDRARQ
jgi:hypothetical protein